MVVLKLAIGRNRVTAFTLIEMLVVLIIMSIIATMATLAINAYLRGREMRILAEELRLVTIAAQRRAILLPANIGLQIYPHRYVFYRFVRGISPNSGEWQVLTRQKILAPKTISGSIVLTVDKTKTAINGPIKPQIIFFTDGTMTPFILTIQKINEPEGYQLIGAANGEVSFKKLLEK